MSTIEGIVTAVVVIVSIAGIAVAGMVRRTARRIDADPRYDDAAGR